MRLKDNFYYDNVLRYKNNLIKLLYWRKDEEKFEILIRDLLSLYLIDYENAGCDEYDKEYYKDILDLYDQYNEDNNKFVSLTCKDLKNIIKIGQKNRISLELNKEIASIFLNIFLETHDNPYYIITQEQFNEICDNLLVE